MDVAIAFLAGGIVGIASIVSSVLLVEHWVRSTRGLDAREVQRRIEGRERR